MKLRAVLWTVGLLLLALLFGWLLPVLVFPARDDGIEEAASPVEIRSVDLSYESDLSVADRMRLIRDSAETVLRLDHGVCLRQEEVYSILDAFLYDLTGSSVSISGQTCYAQPALLNFEGDGSFVVWMIEAQMNEGWMLEAVLDDQSGVLLRYSLNGTFYASWWDQLFPDLGAEDDPARFLLERNADAYGNHLRRRLSEAWTVSLEPREEGLYDHSLLRLSESGEEVLSIPLTVLLEGNRLCLNEY